MWAKPCSFCKGQSEAPCIFCGWKKEPDFHGRSKEGHRERIDFLTHLSSGSMRANNASTYNDEVDALIASHREFAHQIYTEVRINRRSPESVAKDHGLTKSLVLKIVHHELVRMDRKMGISVNPPTPVNKFPYVPGTFSKMEAEYEDLPDQNV